MVEWVFEHAVVGLEGELFERGTAGEKVEDAADEGFLIGGELDARVVVDVCVFNGDVGWWFNHGAVIGYLQVDIFAVLMRENMCRWDLQCLCL